MPHASTGHPAKWAHLPARAVLPAIASHIRRRPGNAPSSHHVPDDDKAFWADFYARLSACALECPIDGGEGMVNPYFGRYGYRWHPVRGKARYFHIGTDMHTATGTPIRAIAPGLLEYSGYAPLNGNYIMLSHPHIVTADGFTLHSVYMHCSALAMRFSPQQKLTRKFISTSLRWVNKPVASGQKVGAVGCTGIADGYSPHLHVQLEFINADGSQRVSVDPLAALGHDAAPNLSAELADAEAFRRFYAEHREALAPWEKFIQTYI